jgi:isoleucyl-tRNA synthetase
MLTYAHADVVGEYREMKAYRLYTVVPRLLKFMDDLTNWYVIINRNTLNVCAAYAGRMMSYTDVW